MTRPLGLGDLTWLWALRGQGITLDMQRAVLWKARPLQAALAGLLPIFYPPSTLTYVCRDEGAGERSFMQVLTCPERGEWQVIHLAPWAFTEDASHTSSWVDALMDLSSLAGERGALRIRAGVAAGGIEEEAFRQAGFVPYTREEVYRLPGPLMARAAASDLRPVRAEDGWPLVQLVGQVVPPTVQHAEGMTLSSASVPILTRLGVTRERGYVLTQGTELGAYVGLTRGEQGVWARILLRSDLRKRAADIVQHVMAASSPAPALYCAVRDYQAGLRHVLAEMGFEFVGVQDWLIKYTARPLEIRCYRQVALDKRTEPATTPLHPMNNTAHAAYLWMTREYCIYDYNRRGSHTVSSN